MSEPANDQPKPLVLATTCGGCKHGQASSADLRVPLNCQRFPPQVTAIPIQTPRGPDVMTHSAYPQVQRNTPSCGEFRSRLQS